MKRLNLDLSLMVMPALSATLVSMSLSILSFLPVDALAQSQDNIALEEVIVTAQRREENLQSTPVAITAYSGQTVEANRIFTMFDLALFTPSFSLTANTPLDLEMNIRGVTNTRLDSPTADPSVGFFFDDVYIGRTGGMNFDFFDIDRIEVIRGPQGVLLGKNVVGGALSVYSKQPEFEHSGEAMVSLGNYSSVLVNGYVTGGLSEELAGRFSFQSRSHDGYAYDQLNDRELENLNSRQFRAQLAYQPKDINFSARFSLDYNKDTSNGISAVAIADPYPASFARSSFRPWSSLRAFLGLTDPRVSVPERSQYAGDDYYHTQYFEREGWGGMLNLEWAFQGSVLNSITSYRDADEGQLYDQTGGGPDVFDELYNFADFLTFAAPRDLGVGALFLFSFPVREDGSAEQFSQEIRLTSNTDNSNWDWIVGGYYKHDKVDKLDRFYVENITGALPTLSGESHWDNRGKMKSIAGFAQLGYRFSDTWKLTIGGRYTKDDKSGIVDGIIVATGDRFHPTDTAPLSLLTENFTTAYGETWNEFTPQGILEFQPSENWYFYGSITTGFKGGGFEDTPANHIAANIAFDPEKVINYETGFKSTLMEGRMRLNATVFYMDYTDLQVQQTNQDCLCNITDNASDAEIKGLEVEFQWLATDGLILFASGSMLDTKYISFLENSGVDSSGNKLQRTPENQFTVGFDWNFGMGKYSDSFTFNINYYWQDELFWQPANLNTEDAYSLVNARLTYMPPGSTWSLSGWVKNVGDKLYRTNIIPFFGDEVSQFGEPRTYGVDLRVNF